MSARTLLALFALAASARLLAVALLGIVLRGDYPVYALVAENMLSGCGVSLSPPGTPCVPHFGGNGLPGYPAFIVAMWTLLGHGNPAVIWGQVALCAAAVPVLAHGVGRMAGARVGLAAGLVAALSPMLVPIVRYGLTEALTAAAGEVLLGVLALSVAKRRLHVVAVAAALAAAIFLRLDAALFALPVACVAVRLHGLVGGARRCVLVGLVLCIPLGAWTARNFARGLDPMPPARGWMLPDGTVGPLGYLAWGRQWIVTEQQRTDAFFFDTNNYGRIRYILPGPFWPTAQTARVEALLAELKAQSGHPFPPAIDAAFAELATEAAQALTPTRTILLRLAQALSLWRYWPDPWAPAPGDLVSGLYRLVLGLAFAAAVVLRRGGAFTMGAVLLTAAKTVLSVVGLFLESRYTWPAIPFMELAVVLAFVPSRPRRPSA